MSITVSNEPTSTGLMLSRAVLTTAVILTGLTAAVAELPDAWKFDETAAKAALAQYRNTVEEARRTLRNELEEAYEVARKKGQIEDAAKIKNAIASIERDEEPPRDYRLRSNLKGTRWSWNDGDEFRRDGMLTIFHDGMYAHLKNGEMIGPYGFKVTSANSIDAGSSKIYFEPGLKRAVVTRPGGQAGTTRTMLRID